MNLEQRKLESPPRYYLNVEQQTPEWHELRMGWPTASMFSTVMAGGRNGEESITRGKYLMKLAGELISGVPAEDFKSAAMIRGIEMEPQIRAAYQLMLGVHFISKAGFVCNGVAGASPDSIIDGSRILEVKSEAPDKLIKRCFDLGGFQGTKLPAEHMAQCQGNLWVCEMDKIQLVIGYGTMRPVVYDAGRDEAFIKRLEIAIDAFNEELFRIVQRYRGLQ